MKARQAQVLSLIWPFAAVIVTRLPFLFNGYGAEEDSWGLVVNAREMAQAGHYMYSRLPGHPLQEIILSIMPYAGPFIFNLFSALFAGMAVFFFGAILKKYGFKDFAFHSLSLAFIPVVYISSVYTIDYCWALAFILASAYFVQDGKPLVAGLVLGLAVGCRLTSAVMIIPFAVMLWDHSSKPSIKGLIFFALASGMVSTLVYLPAVTEYGLSIFSTYKLPYPPLEKVFYKGTLGVLGLTGLIALLYAAVIIFRKRKSSFENRTTGISRLQRIAWLLAILLNMLIYFRLPEKSAFLLPALPFLLLLILYHLKSRLASRIFSLLLLLSPFILSINLTDPLRGAEHSRIAFRTAVAGQEIFLDPINGPIFSDFSKRTNKSTYVGFVIGKIRKIQGPSLIIAGWWYNEIKAELQHHPTDAACVTVENMDEPCLKYLHAQGVKCYYLSEIDRINDLRYHSEFTKKWAVEF